jgi:hypothetical protein
MNIVPKDKRTSSLYMHPLHQKQLIIHVAPPILKPTLLTRCIVRSMFISPSVLFALLPGVVSALDWFVPHYRWLDKQHA